MKSSTSALALLCMALLLSTCTKRDHPSPTTPTSPRAAAVTTPFTTAYVEVNSNSFKNPGCYTYGSPVKQLFSFAVIFAGIDVNGTDQTGASNFIKNNGYAGVMVYNVANNSQTSLSKVSNALYGSATSVKSNCLQ